MSVPPGELLVETLTLGRGGAAAGADPAGLAADWATVSARGLDRLVTFEGCALWLWRRLRELGAAAAPPAAFADWLAREARDRVARNLLEDAQADSVVRRLDAAGVPHVLLKGAARRRSSDLFPYADARATHDVDVLVPAARAREAWDLLCRAGYERTPPNGRGEGHFHLPPLWDAQRVAVELHTSTSEAVAPAEAWRRATTGGRAVERAGVQVALPAPTELLWHGLTHALRHRADAFRLRFLLDGAAILATPAAFDWGEIERRLGTAEIGRRPAAVAWLETAAALAGGLLPARLAVPGGTPLLDLAAALHDRLQVLRAVALHGRLGTLLCWWTRTRGPRRGYVPSPRTSRS